MSTMTYIKYKTKREFPVKLVSYLPKAVNIPESQKQQKAYCYFFLVICLPLQGTIWLTMQTRNFD